jgi:hypothetical protein
LGLLCRIPQESATASTIIHIILIAALLGTAYLGRRVIEKPKDEIITLCAH